MEQKPVSLMKSSLTYGIYLGIASILVSVVIYVLGYTFEKWAQWSTAPITIIGIIWAQSAYRKALGGEMAYGKALGVGTMTVLFASILGAIYTFLLFTTIDPSLQEQLRMATEQQIIEQGRVPEEQIEMAVEMSSKFQTPPIMAIMAVVFGTFIGFIISLITAIFTKKNPSDEVPA